MKERRSDISDCVWLILFVLVVIVGITVLYASYPTDPQSPEARAYAEIARMEWYDELADDNAEIVFDNFGQCEIGVVDLLSNWEDSGEPHHFLDGMMPCFCGNTTDMRCSLHGVEQDLEHAIYLSDMWCDHLEDFEWRTSNSIEALCLGQRYSNVIAGMNLSLDAIEHTNNMLSMVDSGNASFDYVLAEAEISRDLHRQAAHKYSDSSCGTSPDWWGVARRMNVYSMEQGSKLHVLVVEMHNHDRNSSMVIDTNRTMWGFCGE